MPIASRHKLELQHSSELGELDPGEWAGQKIQELDRRDDWTRFNAYRSGTRPPGGELMIETQMRMARKIEEIRQRHNGEFVAVVSHGDPIRAALAHFLGIPLDLSSRLEIDTASVSAIELTDWPPRILCVNETGDVPL
jgi:probable phosphoglycerate mutase